MESEKLIISPKTKVLQLLTAYPQLEDVLVEFVPAFNKLKNPILKKTVAKIATLQQAATIGNVKLEDLINLLRNKVGQDTISIAENARYNIIKPDWFDDTKIKDEIDIGKIISEGYHPINQILSDLTNLKKDEIYKLIAPFIPAPLLDKSLSINIDHWLVKESKDKFIVYFKKR